MLAVVSTANGAAEKHESSVILAGTNHLASVPRKCRSVERDKDKSVLGASDQQRSVVQSEP